MFSFTITRGIRGSRSSSRSITASPSAENAVYATLALGELVSFIDPDVFFDPQGDIHVLQPIAMGTYLYTRADQDGKVAHQTIFKTFRAIPPRLHKVEDGNVTVVGGLA